MCRPLLLGSRHRTWTRPFLGGRIFVTLSTLRVQEPGPTFTPLEGRLPGKVFPTPYRGTTSERNSLGVPGLVDCFLYTCTTVTNFPRGVTRYSSGPLPHHIEGSWCLVQTFDSLHVFHHVKP